MVPGRVNLSIQVRLPHGHPQGWAPVEIAIFCDSVLRGKPGLPRLAPMRRSGGEITAGFTAPVPVAAAHLHFTTGTGRWQERRWESVPARITRERGGGDSGDGEGGGTKGRVVARLPASRPITFFIEVVDRRGVHASTPHETIEE